jgi:acetyl-CoA C-acetyltransferase/acetyl-CoA acyltransferase
MSNIPLLFNSEYKSILQSASRATNVLEKIKCFSKLRPRHFRPLIGIQLGLTDPTCRLNMGQTAEVLAREFGISRVDQDSFAVESHNRALAAAETCFHSGEIVPWSDTILKDLGPRKGQSIAQLSKLRPIFEKDGTVTAGNSCPLTDGAAALVLASEDFVAATGVSPLGYVSAVSIQGCDPRRMGLGPVYAIAKLLKQTGLSLKEIDLMEINEAFAAQVLACLAALDSKSFADRELGQGERIGEVDRTRLNVNGGAIALGHPVGTTGTRLVLTLLRALREGKMKRGIASLCIGGGQGMAMLLEGD